MKAILKIFRLSKETIKGLVADFSTRKYSATYTFFAKNANTGEYTIINYFAGFILNPNKIRPINVFDIIRHNQIIKGGVEANPGFYSMCTTGFRLEEDAVCHYWTNNINPQKTLREMEIPGELLIMEDGGKTILVWNGYNNNY